MSQAPVSSFLPLTHGVNLDKASPPASPNMFTWHRADEQAPVWKLGLAGDGQGWMAVSGEPCCESYVPLTAP